MTFYSGYKKNLLKHLGSEMQLSDNIICSVLVVSENIKLYYSHYGVKSSL